MAIAPFVRQSNGSLLRQSNGGLARYDPADPSCCCCRTDLCFTKSCPFCGDCLAPTDWTLTPSGITFPGGCVIASTDPDPDDNIPSAAYSSGSLLAAYCVPTYFTFSCFWEGNFGGVSAADYATNSYGPRFIHDNGKTCADPSDFGSSYTSLLQWTIEMESNTSMRVTGRLYGDGTSPVVEIFEGRATVAEATNRCQKTIRVFNDLPGTLTARVPEALPTTAFGVMGVTGATGGYVDITPCCEEEPL